MRPIHTILACTDFSEGAEHAVRCAAWLAVARKARLLIVSIVEMPEHHYSFLVEDLAAARTRECDAALVELKASISAGYGLEVEVHGRIGTVVAEVLKLASEEKADLIVCGHKQTSLWDDVTLGSTATLLLYKAPCDVLIANMTHSNETLRVAVPTDMSEAARHAAESAIHTLRRTGGDSLHFIHAVELPLGWSSLGHSEAEVEARVMEHHQGALDEWLAELDTEGIDITVTMRVGSPVDVVAEVCKSADINLVFAGAHGRTAAAAIVLGRHAGRFVRAIPVSFWIVRPADQVLGLFEALKQLLQPE